MTEPNFVPLTVPAGVWSKVVEQIERDLGGPVVPHTPPPRPKDYPRLDRGVTLDTSQPIVSVPAMPTEPATPPTPAETLALADELTAAGTPDETLVGEELRAAITEHICAEFRVDPAEIGVMPTVGFHEPPQPGWLARAIRRIFG